MRDLTGLIGYFLLFLIFFVAASILTCLARGRGGWSTFPLLIPLLEWELRAGCFASHIHSDVLYTYSTYIYGSDGGSKMYGWVVAGRWCRPRSCGLEIPKLAQHHQGWSRAMDSRKRGVHTSGKTGLSQGRRAHDQTWLTKRPPRGGTM